MKRLIRKEDNVSGVISVEAVKEDRSSAKGNTAQATKNELATCTSMTSGISFWLGSASSQAQSQHNQEEGPPSSSNRPTVI